MNFAKAPRSMNFVDRTGEWEALRKQLQTFQQPSLMRIQNHPSWIESREMMRDIPEMPQRRVDPRMSEELRKFNDLLFDQQTNRLRARRPITFDPGMLRR